MPQPQKRVLWEQLQAAQVLPEQANLAELLGQIDQAVSQAPEAEQLQLAGEAFLRLTEVYAARAEGLMQAWEEAYRDPIVHPGFFGDIVRQTMAVDLSELMEPVPLRKPRKPRLKQPQTGSIVSLVDKAAVLAMVEQLETEAQQQVWVILPDENVSRWVEAISQGLQTFPDRPVSLAELCRGLGMPWVEVWLGLLLGGFELEQRGELYDSAIWVKREGKW